MGKIDKTNVGRIAERIVANELEFRGYAVSDLNKEGTAKNADLLAAKNGKTCQIQVKGCSEYGHGKDGKPWWSFQYGSCDPDVIDGKCGMFNKHDGFYRADFVVLVSVKSPTEYCCLVLPVKKAEEAVDPNVTANYRMLTKKGTKPVLNRVFVTIGYELGAKNNEKRMLLEQEQEILKEYVNAWDKVFTD